MDNGRGSSRSFLKMISHMVPHDVSNRIWNSRCSTTRGRVAPIVLVITTRKSISRDFETYQIHILPHAPDRNSMAHEVDIGGKAGI